MAKKSKKWKKFKKLIRWKKVRNGLGLQKSSKSSKKPVKGKEGKRGFFSWFLSFIRWKFIIGLVSISAAGYFLYISYVLIPGVMTVATEDFAEQYGMDLAVEGWSVDWLDAKVTAKDVVLLSPNSPKAIALIPDVSFDFGLYKLWQTRDFTESIHLVDVYRPILNLDRNRLGVWNWESSIDLERFGQTILIENDDFAAPLIQKAGFDENKNDSDNSQNEGRPETINLTAIRVHGLSLNWVQALAGENLESVTIGREAIIKMDDVDLELTNVIWPFKYNNRTQQLNVSGRMGNGEIQLAARGDLLRWEPGDSEFGIETALWRPEMDSRVLLENVGVDTFSYLIPGASVFPQSGIMEGEVRFKRTDSSNLSVASTMDLRDVIYVIRSNAAVGQKVSPEEVQYKKNGFASAKFEGDLENPDFNPASFWLAVLIEDSVRESSESMQLLAAAQTIGLVSGVNENSVKAIAEQRPATVQRAMKSAIKYRVVKGLSDDLGFEGAAILGEALGNSLMDEQPPDSATSGAKKKGTILGNMFGRMFGKKSKKDEGQ